MDLDNPIEWITSQYAEQLPLLYSRCSAQLIDNRHIYLIGGMAIQYGALDGILVYDTKYDRLFTANFKLPYPAFDLACTISKFTRELYCFGGKTTNFFDHTTVTVSDITYNDNNNNQLSIFPYNSFTDASPLVYPKAISTHNCQYSDNTQSIWCFNGIPTGPYQELNDVYEFDLVTNSFTINLFLF